MSRSSVFGLVAKLNTSKALILGLFIIITSLAYFNLKNHYSVQAQCLFNIADWNKTDVNNCLIEGGSINLVGSYGDLGQLYADTAKIVSDFNSQQTGPGNKMTIEYRLYNDSRPLTQNEINAAVATMQDNPMGTTPMLRINNETTDDYVWSGMSYEDKIANLAQTQYMAKKAIDESGGGIKLVSEMLDLWNGQNPEQVWNDVTAYIQAHPQDFPGVSNYHDLYDVYSINGYFEPGNFGVFANGLTLNNVLSKLPEGTQWRFSEFGYKFPGGRPEYTDLNTLEQTLTGLVSWLASNPAHFNTFAGLGIFTQDPHNASSPNIADAIMQIFQNNPALAEALKVFEDPNFARDEAAFQAWLQDLIDEGLLVACTDEDGNILGYAPSQEECAIQFEINRDPEAANPNQCSVGGSLPPDGILRPWPCENCSLNVPEPTNSCAIQPTLSKKGEWRCGEFDYRCENENDTGGKDHDGDYVFLKDWSATFEINTKDTTKVPFAGWRDIDYYLSDDNNISTNLNNYLRDYISGTSLYDQIQKDEPYDPYSIEDQMKFVWQAGVFRKLAPQELQDKLRRNMVLKGYDYKIANCKSRNQSFNDPVCADGISKRLFKTMNEWAARPTPWPGGYFPPAKPDYAECSASSNSATYNDCIRNANDTYEKNLIEWLETDWGKLWTYIPLFTREDSPGLVRMTVEHKPGELMPNGAVGRNAGKYSAEFPMAFPHLGGLYEASLNLNQLLMPTILQERANQVGLSNQFLLAQNTKSPDRKLLAQANIVSDSVDEPKLLAQNQPGTENPPTEWYIIQPSISSDENNYYWNVSMQKNDANPEEGNYDFTHLQFTVNINGQQIDYVGWTNNSIEQGINLNGQIPDHIQFNPGDTVNISVTITGGNEYNQATKEDLVGKTFTTPCTVQADGSLVCAGVVIQPLVPQNTQCRRNGSNINKDCSYEDPLPDYNPNDEVCCNANALVKVEDYKIFVSEGTYKGACCEEGVDPGCEDPSGGGSETMKRQVEVRLKIPYLEKIWALSTQAEGGFFNLFRPESWPEFPDTAAYSGIKYELTGGGGVSLSPDNGDLYYPYLGGTHITKKCVSEKLLTPLELQDNNNYCAFAKGGNILDQPIFDPYLSYTTNQLESLRGDDLNLMNCTDSDFEISDSTKQQITAKVDQSWDKNILSQPSFVDSSQSNWERVVTMSRANGWNPACVLALWIEETGGSHSVATGNSTRSLGCGSASSLNPAQNLEESLACFFSRSTHEYYVDFEPGSREWWLVYAEGQNNNGYFVKNPNFSTNLKSWYDQLTQ